MTSPAEAVDGDSGKRRRLRAGAVRTRLDVARGSARGLGVEVGKRAVETRMLDSALALASRLFVAVIPVALLVSSFLPGGQTFAERLVTGLQDAKADEIATKIRRLSNLKQYDGKIQVGDFSADAQKLVKEHIKEQAAA